MGKQLERKKYIPPVLKTKKSSENRAEISRKIGELTGMDEKEVMNIEKTGRQGALLKIYKALTSVNAE